MDQKQKKDNWLRGCAAFLLLYFIIVGVVYFAAGEQLFFRGSRHEITSVAGDYATPEVTSGFTVRQSFLSEMDRLESVGFWLATFARANTGSLNVKILDDTTGVCIYEETLPVGEIADGQEVSCEIPKELSDTWKHWIAIELSSPDCVPGNAVAPWHASTAKADDCQLFYNGEPVGGVLCFATHGRDRVWTGSHYWPIMSCFGAFLAVVLAVATYRKNRGKGSVIYTGVCLFKKYRFLIKQLVGRDFKIKYRRSVLGVLWSLINPLLMMSVQYVVFSTLFKVDIKNYPVYLLAGVVLFNFFTDATNTAIGAIVWNGRLITKVYVPKYIYPVSKVLSTTINLLLSLVPMFVLAFATGVRATKAWLLIPFVLACLLVFCVGIGFILSAVMVFFRDMQFIWSVLVMVFTYATPVFYPESILPEFMKGLMQYNPMYQFMTFMRTVVMEGISPEPTVYARCILFALVSLVVGIVVFRKTEDKFIFYI